MQGGAGVTLRGLQKEGVEQEQEKKKETKKVNHQPKADKYKRSGGEKRMEIQIIDPKRLSSFLKTKQIFWLEGVAGGGRTYQMLTITENGGWVKIQHNLDDTICEQLLSRKRRRKRMRLEQCILW